MSILEKKIIFNQHAIKQYLEKCSHPIVFTNGVFDLLHRGHVEYLNKARSLGGSLIVGINSDSSVRLLNKGLGRPINSDNDRAYILAGLRCVDLVIIFSDKTAISLLRQIRPDIYVKGSDYTLEELPETKVMQEFNGSTVLVKFLPGYSTSNTINDIKKKCFYEED